MKKVLFTGLPNSGKTHLFNHVTGTYDIEANYAYTTMDMRDKTLNHHGEEWLLTDSPGFHGLFIHSEEEILLREHIFNEKPDILLHCIDSGRFRQGLLLALDLADLKIPMVLVINHVDGTVNRGEVIDCDRLSHLLQIPVVEFDSFGTSRGLKIPSALDSAGLLTSSYSEEVENLLSTFQKNLNNYDFPYRRAAALLMLQKDKTLDSAQFRIPPNDWKSLLQKGQELIFQDIKGDFNTRILKDRQQLVDDLAEKTTKKRGIWKENLPEHLAAISRHPLYGLPLLIVTLVIGYLLVVNLAGFLDEVLSHFIFDPFVSLMDGMIGNVFLRYLLIGEYGIITLGLIAALVTVLPVLTVFFFFFAIVEDTGYLPNLMVLLRRAGEKVGLSGKSLMPLLLGFGCKTMATLSTKTISSRREKLIAIYLIGFAIPCSAQMGLNMAILGKAGVMALIVAFIVLVGAEMGAGLILNRIMPKQESFPFIQELPPFRWPRMGALLKKTGFRIVNFLKESLLVFMIAAVCLYVLDLTGILLALKNFVSPVVVHWLGLPIDMVEGLLLILARNEAGAGYILRMADAGGLTVRQTILSVVLTTMFVPCFANMVAMVKESGRRTGILMIIAINISSIILVGGLNFLIQLVWKGAA